MAPNLLASGSGVSTASLSSSAPAWRFMKRDIARSSASSTSLEHQTLRISSMMNERGDFNGTCTKDRAMTITPETPDGSCTSYFADVTDYCCAAVGGMYNATFRAVNVSEPQALALDHPICATSNYADMFSCYQYVTETHCSSTTPVPYGVCNKNGPDTSRAVTKAASAASPSQQGLPWRWTLAFAGLLACSAIQLLAD
ncbi:uncharacterized protein UMAG_12121 [Mycosarcoma maydis]|uniref:Uncharacterized protein n=1 Tax=Mycosarcoma maydis TaxID=5270 RepID=A0A0D1E9I1_MYCMD|nr:uncharacterized protein UMAG_12121 [Ustilago maydis 521]KIS71035.1 hypothetical protein UMAG_12121 [Ustilago maydis 521]|eukprot:XP_011387488.1 hypothetical protein UMAG_12121 [Ustilago maydis 521]